MTASRQPRLTGYEVTARVPDDADIIQFGITLTGRGRVELRHAELCGN